MNAKIFYGRTSKVTLINKKCFVKLIDQDSAKGLTNDVDIQGYYKRNRNFQHYVVLKPLA